MAIEYFFVFEFVFRKYFFLTFSLYNLFKGIFLKIHKISVQLTKICKTDTQFYVRNIKILEMLDS